MTNLLNGLKVLVIDDSQTVRSAVSAMLKNEDVEVITSVNGFEALSKIVDTRPDIVFIDILMPKLDGYQTCALIKHNRAYKNIPVVLLSSKDGAFDQAKGKIVGADAVLNKPFTKEEIIMVAEKQLILRKDRDSSWQNQKTVQNV